MKNPHPKITFRISRRKDLEAFYCYVGQYQYDRGRSLKWAVLDRYPIFAKYSDKQTVKVPKRKIESFISEMYEKQWATMRHSLIQYEKSWRQVELEYFILIDEFFTPSYWPKGKYIAYPTIWGLCPRYLEDSTFQVPFKHRSVKRVMVIIAHELLHFIFYNYFAKKYPKYRSNRYQMLKWHISEIFNAVVQNSPRWIKVFRLKSYIYPEHRKIVARLQRKNRKNNNWIVDDLITDSIRLLKKPDQ